MNYTIIGHTEDTSYHDRCGDYVSKPGKFETFFFRDDERARFVKLWAQFSHESTYEDLIILLNGCPEDELEGEDEKLFDELGDERAALNIILRDVATEARRLKAERDAAEQVRKAMLAKEAERQRDLQQLAVLQRKLGL
jgi:vacuolar-type H+-ATPase subunit I/STV1